VRYLGLLQRLRRVGFGPAGLVAEPQERAQVLKSLDRRERRVLPRLAECPESVDRELSELSITPMFAVRDQFSLEQFAPLLDRRRRQLPCDGLVEELLDRFFDGRDFGLEHPNLS
jgi:hypothetical protein